MKTRKAPIQVPQKTNHTTAAIITYLAIFFPILFVAIYEKKQGTFIPSAISVLMIAIAATALFFIPLAIWLDKKKKEKEHEYQHYNDLVVESDDYPLDVYDDALENVDLMEGHQFEYFCADLLRKNGFEGVDVTKGSGDQGVDIIAKKDGIKYAIQCKCYSSDLGNKPIQEAYTGKSIYRCQVAAVLTNRYFTQGAKDAAEATGVLLWNRDKLKSLIDNAVGP